MEKTLTQILEEVSIGNLSPQNAREQILSLLSIDHADVDDWLGLKYGCWYHPSIELVNYTNENVSKSSTPLLSDMVAKCYMDMLTLNSCNSIDERNKIVQEWGT